ncbi:hypothetical protein Y032_0365g3576 [Ancylostoma ceylanicum]|uniref:Uncharacterized protein n=1 Tax=Ancylostoma ceylanicum TaxID=53326 RepID=A0A016RUU9_9BILA|nr:hypothetical protein Y032_0365g3576 [Ancylostoma ceylanicum]
MLFALIFSILQFYTTSGTTSGFIKVYSQYKCMGLDDVKNHVTPSFYFVLRASCVLHISTEPIREEVFYRNYHPCVLEYVQPIIFPWDKNSLSIIIRTRNFLRMVIIPATELLEDSTHVRISIVNIHPLYFHHFIFDEDITTCHRSVAHTDRFLCYSFDGFFNVTEYEFDRGTLRGSNIRETVITLPENFHYEPYIASYATQNGKNRLWVKNRSNSFFNFDVDKAKARKYKRIPPEKYEIKDEHRFTTVHSDIIYADSGGIVTRRCFSYLFRGCLYRYSLVNQNPMTSLCLYDEYHPINPGVVFGSWDIATTLSTVKQRVENKDRFNERSSGWPLAYIPIQILAIITFTYLCFFFFFAFRPYPSSNLVELSVIMEDELIRLSILTSEVVKSMKAAQGRKCPPLTLMKHLEDPTQESLEEVCCPGTTCNTFSVIHERSSCNEHYLRIGPAVHMGTTRESGANAMSQTHTNTMLKTETGPRPMTPAPHRYAIAPGRRAEEGLPQKDLVAPVLSSAVGQGKHRNVNSKEAARKL